MSYSTDFPVRDLPLSFDRAAARLIDWDRGGDEPKISYGNDLYTIGGIADLVAMPGSLAGDAPDNIYEFVCKMAVEFASGEEAYQHNCSGPTDHSYVCVAECLRRLYDARVDRHKRRAEIRKPPEPAP